MSAHLPYSNAWAACPLFYTTAAYLNAKIHAQALRNLDSESELMISISLVKIEKRIRCSRVQGSKGLLAKRNSYYQSRVERRNYSYFLSMYIHNSIY